MTEEAKSIVSEIVKDLTGRRGLRHEWSMIDDDVRQEIVSTWEGIVIARLKAEREWVAVAERLPEEGRSIELVVPHQIAPRTHRAIADGYYKNGYFLSDELPPEFGWGDLTKLVTHWRYRDLSLPPLPETKEVP